MRAAADGSAGAVACRSVAEERRIGEALAAGVACVEREAGCPPCPEPATVREPWWGAALGIAAGLIAGFAVGLSL